MKTYKLAKLEKENAKLKKQIANIKYLDRREIERIIYNLEKNILNCTTINLTDITKKWNKNLYEAITQILNLATPTRDKIIEKLGKYGVICGLQEKYKKELFGGSKNYPTTLYEFYGIIASEILEDNK